MTADQEETNLTQDVETAENAEDTNARLADAIEEMNNQWFFRAQNSFLSLIVYNLLRGLAFGLGSFLGATLLVYFLIKILGNIDFVPIIGEWATQIADVIQANISDPIE